MPLHKMSDAEQIRLKHAAMSRPGTRGGGRPKTDTPVAAAAMREMDQRIIDEGIYPEARGDFGRAMQREDYKARQAGEGYRLPSSGMSQKDINRMDQMLEASRQNLNNTLNDPTLTEGQENDPEYMRQVEVQRREVQDLERTLERARAGPIRNMPTPQNAGSQMGGTRPAPRPPTARPVPRAAPANIFDPDLAASNRGETPTPGGDKNAARREAATESYPERRLDTLQDLLEEAQEQRESGTPGDRVNDRAQRLAENDVIAAGGQVDNPFFRDPAGGGRLGGNRPDLNIPGRLGNTIEPVDDVEDRFEALGGGGGGGIWGGGTPSPFPAPGGDTERGEPGWIPGPNGGMIPNPNAGSSPGGTLNEDPYPSPGQTPPPMPPGGGGIPDIPYGSPPLIPPSGGGPTQTPPYIPPGGGGVQEDDDGDDEADYEPEYQSQTPFEPPGGYGTGRLPPPRPKPPRQQPKPGPQRPTSPWFAGGNQPQPQQAGTRGMMFTTMAGPENQPPPLEPDYDANARMVSNRSQRLGRERDRAQRAQDRTQARAQQAQDPAWQAYRRQQSLQAPPPGPSPGWTLQDGYGQQQQQPMPPTPPQGGTRGMTYGGAGGGGQQQPPMGGGPGQMIGPPRQLQQQPLGGGGYGQKPGFSFGGGSRTPPQPLGGGQGYLGPPQRQQQQPLGGGGYGQQPPVPPQSGGGYKQQPMGGPQGYLGPPQRQQRAPKTFGGLGSFKPAVPGRGMGRTFTQYKGIV